MKARTAVIMVTLAVAGIVLYAFDRRKLRAEIEQARSGNRELAAALASSRPERKVQTIIVNSPRAEESAASKEDSPPARIEEAREPTPELSVDDYLLRVQEAYERDPTDAAWARTVRPTVLEHLRPLTDARSSVRTVDCRSTFCRIELDHRDQAAYSEFQHRLRVPGRKPLWQGGMYFRIAETRRDGSLATQVFLVREGVEFSPTG